MKYLYCIYDRIAREAGPIIVDNNDESIQRKYPSAFKDSKVMKKSDFQLVKLGKFDPETMLIEPEEIPEDITPIWHEEDE